MSRFNTRGHQTRPAVTLATSPLQTTTQRTRTYEGGAAWVKDAKTDLFLRASASFADGGNKFYESGEQRDEKLLELAAQVAVEDIDWFAQFVKWLRRTANIRTAALMIAAAGVKARLAAGLQAPVNSVMPTNREIIDSVLYRADEPGEFLAYWLTTYGKGIPKPVKRGVADAVRRLYNERSLLKYDTSSHAVRFADVLNIVHATPDPDKPWQGDLFLYALDRRHHPSDAQIPPSLTMVVRNAALRAHGEEEGLWLNADFLASAGATWEDALSAVGSKVDKGKLWEAMIPSMGYMALLRNLRNFDESGVSDMVADEIMVKLSTKSEVEKSRQLPFRFYSAYLNAPSLRWSYALERALDHCLPNIPTLPGRSLILIDTSGSMRSRMSDKSSMEYVQAAALFGAALALKNPDSVDLYQWADRAQRLPVPKGASVLKLTSGIQAVVGQVGIGTNLAGSIRQAYAGQDRVFVFSDMQTFGGYMNNAAEAVPAHVPVYAFDLSGYSGSPFPTGAAARFQLGGLSDQTFKLIPLLESGGKSGWPWETETVN